MELQCRGCANFAQAEMESGQDRSRTGLTVGSWPYDLEKGGPPEPDITVDRFLDLINKYKPGPGSWRYAA
jgi:hypothetical protein